MNSKGISKKYTPEKRDKPKRQKALKFCPLHEPSSERSSGIGLEKEKMDEKKRYHDDDDDDDNVFCTTLFPPEQKFKKIHFFDYFLLKIY